MLFSNAFVVDKLNIYKLKDVLGRVINVENLKVETQTIALCRQVWPWGINVESQTGALCGQVLEGSH